jgi:hypothetical protein
MATDNGGPDDDDTTWVGGQPVPKDPTKGP